MRVTKCDGKTVIELADDELALIVGHDEYGRTHADTVAGEGAAAILNNRKEMHLPDNRYAVVATLAREIINIGMGTQQQEFFSKLMKLLNEYRDSQHDLLARPN